MYPNLGQHHLAETHQRELQREAEQQRQATSIAPYRNVAQLAVNKLGLLLVRLGTQMKHMKQVKPSPKPITGNL